MATEMSTRTAQTTATAHVGVSGSSLPPAGAIDGSELPPTSSYFVFDRPDRQPPIF